MKTTLVAIALAAGSLAIVSPAQARTATCKITSADGKYNGPCAFTPSGKGSFSVAAPKQRRLVGQTTIISVDMAGGGEAEVRGLTTDGINSRWGIATRSKTNRACWVGSDFSVCAI